MNQAKRLNGLDATLLVMGGIVGIGIFFNPAKVAERVDSPGLYLFLWVFGGVIALCAAFTFAELGATFPRSGGWFVFLRESFGSFVAFLFAWVILSIVSTGAMAAITGFCADSLAKAFPGWLGETGSLGQRVVGLALVFFWTAVTLAGVKAGAMLQNVCMALKLALIAGLVLAGFLVADVQAADATLGAGATTEGTPAGETGFFAALLPVFFTYGGWQMVCYIAPELRDPEKLLPRAILVGVIGVITVYVLVNLAFLRVLGLEGMAGDAGFATRFVGACFGPAGERWLGLGMAVSAFGILGVNVLATPWMYVAMAREGLFFSRFAQLSSRNAPTLALVVQAGLVTVYFFAATLSYLVDSVVLAEWIFHGLVALGLIRLRRVRPELPRPFRSFAYPLAPAIYFLVALALVCVNLWQSPTRFLVCLATVAVGAVVYLPWRGLARSRA